jgi:methylglyoxal synthase
MDIVAPLWYSTQPLPQDVDVEALIRIAIVYNVHLETNRRRPTL